MLPSSNYVTMHNPPRSIKDLSPASSNYNGYCSCNLSYPKQMLARRSIEAFMERCREHHRQPSSIRISICSQATVQTFTYEWECAAHSSVTCACARGLESSFGGSVVRSLARSVDETLYVQLTAERGVEGRADCSLFEEWAGCGQSGEGEEDELHLCGW